jgi:hypothetical protein
MNNNNPNAADASVPAPGTEQAADQVAKQQQPAPAQSSATDTVASDLVTDVAGVAADIIFSIFE